jgi:hypothetical protein
MLFPALQFLVLLEMSLDVSEFGKQLVVHQNLKVFDVVVGLVGALELSLGLSGVHSLKDAEPPEILEWQLEFPDGLASGEVLGLLSLSSFLDFLSH